ncbi:hypothetical protein SBADM41S_11549 [Streptomyces badius]
MPIPQDQPPFPYRSRKAVCSAAAASRRSGRASRSARWHRTAIRPASRPWQRLRSGAIAVLRPAPAGSVTRAISGATASAIRPAGSPRAVSSAACAYAMPAYPLHQPPLPPPSPRSRRPASCQRWGRSVRLGEPLQMGAGAAVLVEARRDHR